MFNNTTGNAILTGNNLHIFHQSDISLTLPSGAVASTYTAGTAIGGLFSGWSAERFGRKKTIIVAAAVGACFSSTVYLGNMYCKKRQKC